MLFAFGTDDGNGNDGNDGNDTNAWQDVVPSLRLLYLADLVVAVFFVLPAVFSPMTSLCVVYPGLEFRLLFLIGR